jgi:ribosomal protein S6
MSDIRRNYELGFHINPNMEEARVAAISNELKEKLVQGQATITFAREPERTRLSYEIKHIGQSYFGYIQFNMENGEGLAPVQEYIQLNNDIMRSLITRLPSDSEKAKTMEQAMKARERIEKKAKAANPKAAPVQNEKLEKELEDIIEKL